MIQQNGVLDPNVKTTKQQNKLKQHALYTCSEDRATLESDADIGEMRPPWELVYIAFLGDRLLFCDHWHKHEDVRGHGCSLVRYQDRPT